MTSFSVGKYVPEKQDCECDRKNDRKEDYANRSISPPRSRFEYINRNCESKCDKGPRQQYQRKAEDEGKKFKARDYASCILEIYSLKEEK
jgi:hypothetical protein